MNMHFLFNSESVHIATYVSLVSDKREIFLESARIM